MYFSQLTNEEKDIVLDCLKFCLYSDALIFEYEARLGITENELNFIIQNFAEIDDTNDDSKEVLAINNCLNEVCHGVFFTQSEWQEWFNTSRDEVRRIYKKWANLRGWKNTGIR